MKSDLIAASPRRERQNVWRLGTLGLRGFRMERMGQVYRATIRNGRSYSCLARAVRQVNMQVDYEGATAERAKALTGLAM